MHSAAADASTTAEVSAAATTHGVRRSTATAVAATSAASAWPRISGTRQNGCQSNDAEDLGV
jgi:hypothetical protein